MSIVKTLREKPYRRAAETEDEAKLRRQREREEGADEIERLRARVNELELALIGDMSREAQKLGLE